MDVGNRGTRENVNVERGEKSKNTIAADGITRFSAFYILA